MYLNSVSKSAPDALELGEQAAPEANQSGERGWEKFERLNSTCDWEKQLQLRISWAVQS